MYTRSYTDSPALTPPEGYSGTMLESEGIAAANDCAEDDAAPASGIFPGFGSLGSIFSLKRPENFKIGTEELLIAAVALFLLFSKNGDKECAIMLLLTLFVTK